MFRTLRPGFPLHWLGFLVYFCLLGIPPALAQSAGNKYVSTELVFSHDSAAISESANPQALKVGLRFIIEPGWHIYWQNSGEAAIPTSVSWTLPEGWTNSSLHWPAPKRFIERGEIVTYGYSGETLLFADLSPAPLADGSQIATVSADVRWLVCSDICVPGQKTLSAELPISSLTVPTESGHRDLFQYYSQLVPDSSHSKALKEIALNPTLEKSPVHPGDSITAALIIDNLPGAENLKIQENIQLFPLKSEFVEFSRAQIARDSLTPTRYILTLPLRIRADTDFAEYKADGILVISKELLGEKQDAAISWSIPLALAETNVASVENKALTTALAASSPFFDLSFRQSSYQDHQEADNQLLEPTPTTASLSWLAILQALVYAFIGGMLLNLMPCVLPIISIKVLGFISAGELSRGKTLANATAYSLGILASFWTLAAIVIALRATGASLGWGFQFQHPQFVLGLTLIVYLLCLGFFDVYSISLPYLQNANRAMTKLSPSLLKHFFDGVLATALSTPCTAPFLGVALVFAFAHGAPVTVAIFTSIGLGLALPYAYLSTHPKLLSKLPKPGPWMSRIRQLMGFLLLATVVWLLFVLHRLTDEGVIWSLALMLIGYFCFWVFDWLNQAGVRQSRKALTLLLLLGGIFLLALNLYPRATASRGSGYSVEQSSAKISWQPFDRQAIAGMRRNGKTVFIDFTADWCITCKANEFLVIETDTVAEAISQLGIVAIKADWTDGNPQITKELKNYGGEGVPFYIVLPGNPEAKAIILPAILSTSTLLEAFNTAADK